VRQSARRWFTSQRTSCSLAAPRTQDPPAAAPRTRAARNNDGIAPPSRRRRTQDDDHDIGCRCRHHRACGATGDALHIHKLLEQSGLHFFVRAALASRPGADARSAGRCPARPRVISPHGHMTRQQNAKEAFIARTLRVHERDGMRADGADAVMGRIPISNAACDRAGWEACITMRNRARAPEADMQDVRERRCPILRLVTSGMERVSFLWHAGKGRQHACM